MLLLDSSNCFLCSFKRENTEGEGAEGNEQEDEDIEGMWHRVHITKILQL